MHYFLQHQFLTTKFPLDYRVKRVTDVIIGIGKEIKIFSCKEIQVLYKNHSAVKKFKHSATLVCSLHNILKNRKKLNSYVKFHKTLVLMHLQILAENNKTTARLASVKKAPLLYIQHRNRG